MFLNKYPYTDFHELNLDWVLSKIKEFGSDLKAITDYLDTLKDKLDLLDGLYDAIVSGDFPQPVKDAFSKWMRENATDLVGDLVHMVFFGLNDNGYFVVYIPEYWDDLQFGTTGLDDFPAGISYGHLTISY